MGVTEHRLPKLHYQSADGVLNCKGPLSDMIASNILAEVKKEVKLAATGQKKKRGSYLSSTPTENSQVVQYSNVMEFEQCHVHAHTRTITSSDNGTAHTAPLVRLGGSHEN